MSARTPIASPNSRPWSSGPRSASIAALSGLRGACSNAYYRNGPPPERCIEAYYLQRTRFESIAERKLRRRQLTEDGNAEISGARFAQSTRPKLCPPARSVSNRPRLCKNAQEPTMRRIVFSIAHFLIAATALFLFRLTKSRKTFYVQVECLCFHTACTQLCRSSGGPPNLALE